MPLPVARVRPLAGGRHSSCREMSAPRRRSRFAPAAAPEPLYLPPHKVAALQLSAVSREERQRLAWEQLRKRIHGVVNRANSGNAAECVLALLRLNLVRGMGLLCRSLLRAQVVSQSFSPVYAAIVAALNARLPELGQVLLARILEQLKRGMDESDRGVCVASVKFIAHLYNQSVVDALLPLEIMHVLASAQTNDSVELLVAFIKECGALLSECEPRMLDELFQIMRTVVQEGEVDTRIQYLVEGLIALRRNSFKGFAVMPKELELIPDEDRIIHNVAMSGESEDLHPELDVFAVEKEWEEAEVLYAEFRLQVLGEEDSLLFEDAPHKEVQEKSDVEMDGKGGDLEENEVTTSAVTQERPEAKAADMTEDELVTFRRKVYLQIMSAVGYEECAHKLAGFMRSQRGREGEMCNMVIECCSQERTFMRYYGLVGKQFCLLNRIYVEKFEETFAEHYSTIHQFDSRKIRNMAYFYAFLLSADALPWSIFGVVVLSEDETTSSTRIFLKYVLQELAKILHVADVKKRFADERLQPYTSGLFPLEVPANMRFAINFHTAIGLGPLTDDMRARLREMPLRNAAASTGQKAADEVSSSSSSSMSSSSSSDLSSSSSDGRMADRRDELTGRKRPPSHVHAEDRSPDRYNKVARHSFEHDGPGGLAQGADRPSRRNGDAHYESTRAEWDGAGRGRGRGRGRGFGDGNNRVPGGVNMGREARGLAGRGGPMGRGLGRGQDLTVPAWVMEARKNRAVEARKSSEMGIPPPPPPRADKGQPRAPHLRDRGDYRSRGRSRSQSASRSPSPSARRRTPSRYRDRSMSRERSPTGRVERSPLRRVSRSPLRRDDSRSPRSPRRYPSRSPPRHRNRSPDDDYDNRSGRSPPRSSRFRNDSSARDASARRAPSDDSWERYRDRRERGINRRGSRARRYSRSRSRSRSPSRSPLPARSPSRSPLRARSRSPSRSPSPGNGENRDDMDDGTLRGNDSPRNERERSDRGYRGDIRGVGQRDFHR